MVFFNAKDVEVYLGKIDDLPAFVPSSRATKTLATFIEDLKTANDVSGITKVSGELTEVSIEPAEDDTETRKYYGSTSDGAQNSEVISNTNADVDITLTTDATFEDNVAAFCLDDSGVTVSSVSGYESYNLGALSTDSIFMFIRCKRLVGTTYYFKNYLIMTPVFKKSGEQSGSSDDTNLTVEYGLLGTKSKVWKDYYNDTTDETLSWD